MKAVINIFKGADGWYIRLVAPNGQVTLVSESYTRKWSAKRAAKRTSTIFGGLKIIETQR